MGDPPKTIAVQMRRARPRALGAALGLAVACALTLLAYARIGQVGFALDDRTQVIDNVWVGNPANVRDLLSRKLYFGKFAEVGYRPVLTLSYFLDRALWRRWHPDPAPYHLFNVALHVANVALVFLLARLLLQSSLAAALAAAVFGIHPVNSEVVCVLTFRDDSLSLLFSLASLLLFVRGERTGKVLAHAVAASLLFLLAAFTKEQAAVLPLIFVLWRAVFGGEAQERQWSWRNVVPTRLSYLPYAAAAVLFVSIRLGSFSSWLQGIAGSFQEPLWVRALTAPKVLSAYVWRLLLPVNQSSYYAAMTWQRQWLSWTTAVAALLIFALAALTLLAYRRHPVLAFCGGWFFINVLPVADVFPILNFAAFDRYLYAASAAFGIAMAYAVALVGQRRQRPRAPTLAAVAAIVLCCLGFYSALTQRRLTRWTAPLLHWTDAVLAAPRSEYVRCNLGSAYVASADKEGAEAFNRRAYDQFEKAITIEPGSASGHLRLGFFFLRRGRTDDAIEHFQQSIATRPNFRAYVGLGDVYANQGNTDIAVASYQQAIELQPLDPAIYYKLAWLLIHAPQPSLRDPARAIREATAACKMTRWSRADYIVVLAQAHLAAGQHQKAVRFFQRALQLDPDNATARAALDKLR